MKKIKNTVCCILIIKYIYIYICLVFQFVGVKLPYDTLNEVRDRLTDVCPSITRYGDLEQANYLAQASDLAKVTIYSLNFNVFFFFFY